MGDHDNADVVEDNQNVYRTTGGRLAALWKINPEWESTLSVIASVQRGDGAWETDPALGDNKVTRFFDEWRDDDWYRSRLDAKGDLGFAELSMTASYFDRKIDYEWDNTNYSQWRTAYYGGFDPDYRRRRFNIYDTGTLIGTTFNFQKQNRWAYEVRLTSQGDSKLQWMAGAFYEDVYDWWEYGAMHARADAARRRGRRRSTTPATAPNWATTSHVRSRRPTSTTPTSTTRP